VQEQPTADGNGSVERDWPANALFLDRVDQIAVLCPVQISLKVVRARPAEPKVTIR